MKTFQLHHPMISVTPRAGKRSHMPCCTLCYFKPLAVSEMALPAVSWKEMSFFISYNKSFTGQAQLVWFMKLTAPRSLNSNKKNIHDSANGPRAWYVFRWQLRKFGKFSLKDSLRKTPVRRHLSQPRLSWPISEDLRCSLRWPHLVVDPDFELKGGGGGSGFVLLTLPAFLPCVIFFSLPKIRRPGLPYIHHWHIPFPGYMPSYW